MTSLVTIKGPIPGQRFTLLGDSALIGRQEDATIYLDSLAVSRQHARIHCHGGEYFIEDIGSSNGTFLNGRRITQPVLLRDRDQIEVGPFRLVFRQSKTAYPGGVSEQTSADQTIFAERLNLHQADAK